MNTRTGNYQQVHQSGYIICSSQKIPKSCGAFVSLFSLLPIHHLLGIPAAAIVFVFFGPPWTNAKPKNRTLGPWGDGKEGNSINSSLVFFPTVQTRRDFHQSGVVWGLQKGLVRWCKFEANGWEHVAGSPQQKNS